MLKDHSVVIDRTTAPLTLQFAPVFNVAVPFIDRHCGEGRGDKIAIRTNQGDEVSYRLLSENVNRCGNLLLDLGLERGDRVLLIMKDCAEFFYVFWGAIKAGLVPVPINTLLRAKDYAYILADSGCKVLIFSTEYTAAVKETLALLEVPPAQVLCVEGDVTSLQSLMPTARVELEAIAASAEDDCFWLYSSGSTGNPKGTVHRQRDMVVTSQCYGVEILGMREEDVCFSAAKLFFAYGLGNGMCFPLWVGGTAVLYDGRPTPQSTFATIEQFKPTLYFGVPTLYAGQLQALASEKPDLSSIRLCVSAGEALPADIFNRWREATGLVILDGIGSTEALHIFISNRVDDLMPGSSGRVVPGYRLKIIDDAGQEAAAGDPGRLWISGGSTARCYWNQPEKTALAMVDGWLDTGDTYFQDDDGYYYYCGRNDDMMKVGGIWCSPFEIEAKLIEHTEVLEVAVVGRADGVGLIKPEAYIVLKNPAAAGKTLSDELRQHCKTALAPYKYPRQFHFVEELPKTATGKIQRYKLRTMVVG
ncbi:benzoate-CoA ligase family protein [Geopsychrobacter electrodiphilus]|uniref:benzoate-CoA ligase family protein n=1 Tax=Geopsychrobacter electrodiphilus TaxID=225196 RepID=UPI00037C12EA|nr:benzoate-CoA ligase family protein [Geopsychrobacter electrodiphilus]